MTDVKLMTMADLQKALEAYGMDPESLKATLELVAKAVGKKYTTELYAALPHEVIEQIQTMSKDTATKIVHETFFAKTGVHATDRLDEIISLTVEDMIARPADFFKKK